MAAGITWVLLVAWWLGKKERARIGVVQLQYNYHQELSEKQQQTRRPKLFWFNAVFTVVLVVCLIKAVLPPAVLFIVGFSLVLLINYPQQQEQKKRLAEHAYNAFNVSLIIFAAGIFSGILTGTKMITAMASSLVSILPQQHAGYLPVATAVTSMPLSLVFTPDAYYFGVLPVLKEAATHYGLQAIEVGRGAVLGQMTTGFPVSPLTAATFVLVGLAEVDLADHQKFTIKWAFGTTLVMTITALITGAIHI
jgi:CitMHS family citrate-Mg2+:H+ or citrate-Ca2+:H+ symporter